MSVAGMHQTLSPNALSLDLSLLMSVGGIVISIGALPLESYVTADVHEDDLSNGMVP